MIPSSAEETARELAWRRWELTEEELDRLASDSRFVTVAYLRDEAIQHGNAQTLSTFGGESDGPEDPENYAKAQLSVDAAIGAFGTALDAYAEDVLGRLPEEREYADVLEELAAIAEVDA